MGFYTSLVSSALFPLHERLKRHDSVSVRRQMEEAVEREDYEKASEIRDAIRCLEQPVDG